MADQDEFTWITEVLLAEYDPDWPVEFISESRRVQDVLGEKVVGVHHVGSTAVNNLIAKPVIDLLVEVADLEPIDAMTDSFIDAGYEVRGESGIPGRRFLTRNEEGQRTHDIHIFQTGHNEIAQMLLFRDRLRESPDVAASYADLKRELAAKFPDDVLRYTQEKTEFILGAVEAQRRVVAIRSD